MHYPWWRHQMETFSALLAICAGNSPVPGEFPAQRPVTRSFDVFFDQHLNKRLSEQSWGWWFETPSRPLWRHRNVRSYGGRLGQWEYITNCQLNLRVWEWLQNTLLGNVFLPWLAETDLMRTISWKGYQPMKWGVTYVMYILSGRERSHVVFAKPKLNEHNQTS